jgi:hypothetical protein
MLAVIGWQRPERDGIVGSSADLPHPATSSRSLSSPARQLLSCSTSCFVAAHNREPKPFVWKADFEAIIAAAKRGYQAFDSIQ